MMSSDLAIYLSKQFLWQALLISSPVVLATLICGLIVSIIQVITQIQDSIVSTVPKILVALLTLMVMGEWMLHGLMNFARNIFYQIPQAVQ